MSNNVTMDTLLFNLDYYKRAIERCNDPSFISINSNLSEVQIRHLDIIYSIVQDILKHPLFPEKEQGVKNLLKQINVQPENRKICDHIMKRIEKASPTYISEFDLASHGVLPPEVSSQITAKIENIELLNLFAPNLSSEKRFELALQSGEELTRLDLSYFWQLDDEKLKTLCKACPNLRSLNLSHVQITEELDLSILDSFPKLESLDVSNTKIRTLNGIPKNLKELNLKFCPKLELKEYQKLHAFLKLETLFLTEEVLDEIPKNLKKLFIGGAIDFTRLNDFSQLENLSLPPTYITIEFLDKIPKNLKELSLVDSAAVEQEAFQKLNDFSQLEILNLSGTDIKTLDGIPKNLKELSLVNCKDLEAEEFQKLNDFPQLEILDVRGTHIGTLDIHPKNLKQIIRD